MGALLDVRARGTSVEDDLNEAPDIISTTRRATTQPWQLSPSDLHGLDRWASQAARYVARAGS